MTVRTKQIIMLVIVTLMFIFSISYLVYSLVERVNVVNSYEMERR